MEIIGEYIDLDNITKARRIGDTLTKAIEWYERKTK